MSDILLVEDKESLRQALRLTLENANYSVCEAADVRAASAALAERPFRLVLSDLRLPKGSGLDVLRAVQAVDAETPVILMTAFGSIDEAVQAMKQGAHDFLQKPVDSNHLLLLIERALEQARLRTEYILLKEEYSKRFGFPRIIGESEPLKRAVAETQRVARTGTTAFLLGESGTGKELFARAVHYLSERRSQPFVAINCAAIPETLIENELFGHERGAFTGASERRPGKFELASGGTIFLDEIGELPLGVQGKLLRAIEEKVVDRIGGRAPLPVNVRIVAATNRDLPAAIEAGEFRRDLYFRLAVFPIVIPPLRERGSDVALLARFFAAQFGRETRGRPATLSEAAERSLRAHDWPGNVRELKNVLERACILADSSTLEPIDLNLLRPASIPEPQTNDFAATESGDNSLGAAVARAVGAIERRMISEALAAHAGNKSRAAEALGVSYKTLLNKIRDYGLSN